MRVAALALIATLVACKEKREAAPAPPAPTATAGAEPGAGSNAAPKPAAPRPTLPAPEKPAGEPVSIPDATGVLPALDGKEILPLKQTSDKRQVHGTWCMDGDGADDVAKRVGRTMGDAKFTAISIRGDARKAGVQGDRDGFRMSMVVSASSAANCPAPKHYFASATIFKP